MTERCKHANVRDIFQCGSSCGYYIWVRDIYDDSPHGPGPGVFIEQGGLSYHRKIATAASRRKLAVPYLEEVMEE